MTKIKFYKNKNNYYKLEVSGHTGYEESGKDILCASISAITQAGAIGINEVIKANANIEINETNGYLKIELTNNISNNMQKDCNIIFQVMFKSLKDISKSYSNYIKMEVISNDD